MCAIEKSSVLRNFFENSKEYLVVPCYEENETEKKYNKKNFYLRDLIFQVRNKLDL